MWVVRDQFNIYSPTLLLIALFGSVFPDFEHFLFFFTYGRGDAYTKQIKAYIRDGDWRVMARFIEQGHKYNTQLRLHNVYMILVCFFVTLLCFSVQYYVGAVFVGAMITHYLFDILDDLATIGKLNTNWFRFGRGEKKNNPSLWKKLDRSIDR